MRLFLDSMFDRKMYILNFIESSKNPVTIKEITEKTGLSKKTVSKVVKEFAHEHDKHKGNFETVCINGKIKNVQAQNLDLEGISSNYLKQSILYEMIKELFLYDNIDAIKFCDLKFISTSTFSRYRKKLQGILRSCGLSLSRTNQIIGDELQIRNFFLLFFSSSGSQWEFDIQEFEFLNKYLSRKLSNWNSYTFQERKKIILIIHISNVRFRQRNLFYPMRLQKIAELHTDSIYTKVLYDYFSIYKNKNKQQLWNELSIALFFLYKERLIKEELDMEAYNNYFSSEKFSFVYMSEKFTKKIIDFFFDGAQDINLYWRIRQEMDLFHLQLELCFIDSHLFYYIYDEKNLFHLDPFEEEIRRKVAIIFKELKSNDLYRKLFFSIKESAILEYLYLMIYTLVAEFSITKVEPIKIVLKNSKVFVKDILENKITSFFGESIKIVNINEPVDIVVTDISIPSLSEEIQSVYVTTFSDLSDLSTLFGEISSLIIKKFDDRKMITIDS
ncbi:helix-turn-helix domain-containing protein [Enterococcus rivorum]|uniref:Mga helix-turn-helix domain-containing protein n=2 Tax=Enterococcus rivorum TaxID=762845 RepID=A0A1E5KSR4_9ENTE|nr:helix-turn-helix domain-containing protein [Enterococcus rivorum]MBP2098185.1 hypothetical protein [Enterococcus rivorum]OEH80893.1 hypothetical protein BCR26_06585 [Enterococcus rivorum]